MIAKTVSLLVLSLFLAAAGAQPAQIEVIPLNSSTVDEVIEVVRPLLAPGGTVSGMNNQLIIKTTPANLEEIKDVLQTIDRPRRRLMITVRQGVAGTETAREHSLSGTHDSGDTRISGRPPVRREGIVISGKDEEGNSLRYHLSDSTSAHEGGNTHSVQTLEGEPAFIQSGRSIPVPNRNTYITRNGVIVQDTTEYRDISSGFYVLPRVSGDTVTVMIAPRSSSVSEGRLSGFDIQNVRTTISGRLGEWLDIGGIDQISRDNSHSPLSHRQERREEQRTVLIKVDEIH